MKEYVEYLKNPFIAGIVSGLIIVLFAYIDKHMNDRDFENNYYYKLFISVFIMVAGLVYFAGTSSTKKITGGVSSANGRYDSSIVNVIKDTGSNFKGNGLDVFSEIPDF